MQRRRWIPRWTRVKATDAAPRAARRAARRSWRGGGRPRLAPGLCLLLVLLGGIAPASAGVAFRAHLDPRAQSTPISGRLVVYVSPSAARDPARGVGLGPAQPVFGIDVRDLRPGQDAVVDDSADAFPVKPSKLPAGRYAARAVLDWQRLSGDWWREPGNLHSDLVEFEVGGDDADRDVIELPLTLTVHRRPEREFPGIQIVTIRSRLLSEFAGHDVDLKAALILPTDYNPARKYAAIYDIPGFGGSYRDAFGFARARETYAAANAAARDLYGNVFEIFLHPDSPNGHTLFCDSDVNGPWGRALTEELIPALEAKYPLIPSPDARLLRGHSSGGWSTIWLATEYPGVFGAAWASSPDPVDFRRFQRANLYEQTNFFRDASGNLLASMFNDGQAVSTIEQENRVEQVIGPNRTSALQWAAWQSCWGRRAPDGSARALYHPVNGEIDRDEAESYRRFDIVDRLRKHPDQYLPLFRDRIRIIVGDRDEWDLHQAVGLLKDELALLDPELARLNRESEGGYIKILRGYDHSSIFESPQMNDFASQMLRHLRAAGAAQPAGRSGR